MGSQLFNTAVSSTTADLNDIGTFLVRSAPPSPLHHFGWQHSTIPSSSPPLHTYPLYGRVTPLPEVISMKDIHIHPALKCSPNPSIIYNLLDHPSRAGVALQMPNFPPTWGEEVATYPRLHDMTIRVPNLDKPVHINRICNSHLPYVTVNDIFVAVHSELRHEAYEVLRRGLTGHEALWANSRDVYPYHAEEDIQRAITHLLGGRVFWDGMTPSLDEHDVWVLHLR